MLKWLNPSWWKYLLEKPAEEISFWTAFQCRRRGHPYPVVWYNASGWEPDMTCTNCGDDLG